MNPSSLLAAEPLTPTPNSRLSTPDSPTRHPIRHLLIGSPETVQLTVHQLHNLRYAEAGLWSPAIALSHDSLILTLSPGEVMRVLVRYVQLHE